MLSCSKKEQGVSTIIIAVDSLRYDDLSCSLDSQRDRNQFGIDYLCDEGIRFTHIFSNNLYSQPSLTSLLTGLNSEKHKIIDNKTNSLSKKIETISEIAVKKGIRTAFFSGGGAIWSKSGLNQGFELFDDFVEFNKNILFRQATSSFVNFKKWLDKINENEELFTVFYLPDLHFTDKNILNEEGTMQSIGRKSSLVEINNFLNLLVIEMKKRKRWSNTAFYFIGLKGFENFSTRRLLPTVNLHSENVRTKFIYKPPIESRDSGLGWRSETPIDIVTVGQFIKNQINRNQSKKYNYLDEVKQLSQSKKDKKIMTETPWCEEYKSLCQLRAFRISHYMGINYKSPAIYNSLMYRYENTSLPKENYFYGYLLNEFKDQIISNEVTENDLLNMSKVKQKFKEFWSYEEKFWFKYQGKSDHDSYKDLPIYWKVNKLIFERRWKQLLDLVKDNDEFIAEQYLALQYFKRNKSSDGLNLKKIQSEPCLTAFIESKWIKNCNNLWLKKLIQYKQNRFSDSNSLRTFYQSKLLKKQLAIENIKNYLIWDVNLRPLEKTDLGDLFILLPENTELFNILYY
jgi:hypothetical protein